MGRSMVAREEHNQPSMMRISDTALAMCMNKMPSLEQMVVVDLDGTIHARRFRDDNDHHGEKKGDESVLAAQIALALQDMGQALLEHLNLSGKIEEIELIGNNSLMWVKNITNDMLVEAVVSTREEINELRETVMESFLRDLLSSVSAKTVSLVSSDSFPIWIEGQHELAQVAAVAANILSATERLGVELKVGAVNFIEVSEESIEGTNHNIFAFFNETQDLMLLCIGVSEDDADLVIEIGTKFFRRFVRQESSTLIIPQNLIQDRDARIREILEETRDVSYSGDIQEELATLQEFSEETINELERMLKDLYRRYRCREVSIPYLRKRMKLQPTVINLILQSLMFEGRLGNSQIIIDPNTKVPFLRMDLAALSAVEDPSLVKEINDYKDGLLQQVISRHLKSFERLFLEDVEEWDYRREALKERFSEIQVLIDLVDTSEIMFLVRTLKKEWQRLQELKEGVSLLEKQVEKQKCEQPTDSAEDVVLIELENRYHMSQRKIQDQTILISSYKRNLDKSLKDTLQLLSSIFPLIKVTYKVGRRKKRQVNAPLKGRVIVECGTKRQGEQCDKQVDLSRENGQQWFRLFLIQLLSAVLIQKKKPRNVSPLNQESLRSRPQLNDLINSWLRVNQHYEAFMNDTHNEMDSSDVLSLLDSLETLLLSRGDLLTLHHALNEAKCYETFHRCRSCGDWYCVDHCNAEKNACVHCDSSS